MRGFEITEWIDVHNTTQKSKKKKTISQFSFEFTIILKYDDFYNINLNIILNRS